MSEIKTIPTRWYFDSSIEAIERAQFFQKNTAYIGHSLMAPKTDDFYVSERANHAKVLFNRAEGYNLLSNICRHHEAILLQQSGNTQKILCPIHKWSYGSDGVLINAPRFSEKPCLHLENQPLSSFHNLLFLKDEAPDIALPTKIINKITPADFQFHKASKQTYSFNWKIFMEVYLDNYHIPVIHPGLSRLVDVQNQEWQIGEDYSAQCVKLHSSFKEVRSESYQSYQKLIKEHRHDAPEEQEIMWLALYPNLMIERYPFAMVISTVTPLNPDECLNQVEYFVDRTIAEQHPDFPKVFEAAYAETANEDAKACELIHEGRKAMYQDGSNQASPHHPLMEEGLPSFYAFMHRKIRL